MSRVKRLILQNPSHEIQIILNHLTQVRLLEAYDRKLAVVARAET